MVLVVKKFVKVYDKSASVPKKYKNLRKNKYVTSFKYPYPNMGEILVKEYGLKWDEKILVFWMKEVNLPHFARYRTKFRKVYYGSVRGMKTYIVSQGRNYVKD